MQRFLKWYKQSRKNKVIVFSIIFIVALLYSFLHRPLGLIVWYQWSYSKEYKQMEADLYKVQSNEKEFFELYHNFYEKENIAEKSKKIEKELLKYIDWLEIDLLASSFVGLSELYMKSLASKIGIYTNDLEWKLAYSIFKPYSLTSEQTQSYYNFLKAYNKFLFFVNRLDDEFIVAKLHSNLVVFKLIGHLLLLTEERCFMKDDILDIVQKSYDELKRIDSGVFKSNLSTSFLNAARYVYDTTKDKLNECE